MQATTEILKSTVSADGFLHTSNWENKKRRGKAGDQNSAQMFCFVILWVLKAASQPDTAYS